MQDEKKVKDAINEDIKSYKKLEKINQSQEFDDFFQMQITTAVQKIISCFAGEGPKDWQEFCRIRGEVVGILYPIQQVRGAKLIAEKLQEQLDSMYNNPVS